MAEKLKNTRTAPKPKKTATRKHAAEDVRVMTPSREKIEELARKFWAEQGWRDGFAEHDWLRAEQELRVSAS